MRQSDQSPDVRMQLKAFVEKASFLNVVGISELAGLQYNVLYRWLTGASSSYIESVVRAFLEGDGKQIMEISQKLKTGKTDRVALHQQRAQILQKARIHSPSKTCAPSLDNSTI